MSDETSEIDEIDSSFSVNSELELAETISNVSSAPPQIQEPNFCNVEASSNVVKNLFRREIGRGCLKPIRLTPVRSYHLRHMFPKQILANHVFMGMSKCGRFLITYTMTSDQDDEEWYATVYKYRLHWWTFKPGGQARKTAEVSLFGNHKIVAPLQIFICQWPQDFEKILAEECGIDTSAAPNNRHAFVTVTALPSVDNCQDCRVVASSYMLDDIAASWDTCLRFSCLKHGYTVHTSFDVVVPFPEFIPKVSLKCQDYAVFNTNNFLYALKIDLEHCERKPAEGCDDVASLLLEACTLAKAGEGCDGCDAPLDGSLTSSQRRGLRIKEQIIRDFSEEIVLNPPRRCETKTESDDSKLELDCGLPEARPWLSPLSVLSPKEDPCLMSPPLPTRVVNFAAESSRDCFRCPAVKPAGKRDSKKVDARKGRFYKPFFTKYKGPSLGVFVRNLEPPRPVFKQPLPVAECDLLRCSGADTTYEFVDDSHHEVEKLSQFRRKRLADKKYEFQDCDSENIVPFSIVRQENTLRSPRKASEAEQSEGPASPEGGEELSVSVASPPSPAVEGVLRPLNRNQLPSPMSRAFSSPPPAQKPTKPTKPKGCDARVRTTPSGANCSTNLDTRSILSYGILVHDISQRYPQQEASAELYDALQRCGGKLTGRAVRFTRRFVEVDDELVSVITDVEDDDMSAVSGYHTALNLEVHGAGYVQLQMISNGKAEKLVAPCVAVEQQSLDIEAVCHSVATTLCHVAGKTFTFCNDYDIEVLDVCPRSGDVLVLLMMRIEGCEGKPDEVTQLQYEACVTFTWNLHSGQYRVCMVVPPQRVNWVWDDTFSWNPAREASRRFRMQVPADVTLCEPAVRVCANSATLRGISLTRIQDLENVIQFVL